MPEPMPASWLSPIKPQPPSAILRHITGAALGLSVGLALAVPLVLWQKGRIDPVGSVIQVAANFGLAVAAPSTSASVVTEARKPVAVMPRTAPPPATVTTVPGTIMVPVEVARQERQEPAAATASSAVAVLQPVAVEPTPQQTEAAKVEALLDDARRLIGDGDFRTARSVLEDQSVATLPEARFLLAETYDPNYLAARGVRSVRAEVPRALELYREALAGGVEAARQRISGLRP